MSNKTDKNARGWKASRRADQRAHRKAGIPKKGVR